MCPVSNSQLSMTQSSHEQGWAISIQITCNGGTFYLSVRPSLLITRKLQHHGPDNEVAIARKGRISPADVQHGRPPAHQLLRTATEVGCCNTRNV